MPFYYGLFNWYSIYLLVRPFNRYSPEVAVRRELMSVLRLQRKAFPLLILISVYGIRVVRLISSIMADTGAAERGGIKVISIKRLQ